MYVASVARRLVAAEQELCFHPSEVLRWVECLERQCDRQEAVSPQNANPRHWERKPNWGPLALELDTDCQSVVELWLVGQKIGWSEVVAWCHVNRNARTGHHRCWRWESVALNHSVGVCQRKVAMLRREVAVEADLVAWLGFHRESRNAERPSACDLLRRRPPTDVLRIAVHPEGNPTYSRRCRWVSRPHRLASFRRRTCERFLGTDRH